MEEEDISDRTPVLDKLIEKWKYIVKTKRSMIDRYMKNLYLTMFTFEKMCNVIAIY